MNAHVDRRLLVMLRELHGMGYERLRAVTGVSPSGFYWRLRVTHAGNVGPAPCGERLVHSRTAVARYTTGQGASCFGWEDADEDSPSQLAGKFIERFPEIVARGRGADPSYARWYAEMIEATEPDGLIFMYADWDMPNDHVSVMNGPEGCRIPLPPRPIAE